jgi:hypothetical protein
LINYLTFLQVIDKNGVIPGIQVESNDPVKVEASPIDNSPLHIEEHYILGATSRLTAVKANLVGGFYACNFGTSVVLVLVVGCIALLTSGAGVAIECHTFAEDAPLAVRVGDPDYVAAGVESHVECLVV